MQAGGKGGSDNRRSQWHWRMHSQNLCPARAEVVIADVHDDLGHSVRESISPSDCMFVHCDVTDEA